MPGQVLRERDRREVRSAGARLEGGDEREDKSDGGRHEEGGWNEG